MLWMVICIALLAISPVAVNAKNVQKTDVNGGYACADIRYAALHNDVLFGGDMLLNSDNLLRNGVVEEEYRWPGYPGAAIIPYVIDQSLEDDRDSIEGAMDDYHKTTCVRFVPRTNEDDYVLIFNGSGCYSTVGRSSSSQPQLLSLGDGCISHGTILHELGHTIGFYHEQNRSDRDDFLIVHQDNIKQGQKHNFRKLSAWENILLTPFDYESIMMYGNYAFSKNPDYDVTIEARNGQPLRNPYEKIGLTESDVQRVRMLYKCDQ